MPKKRCLKVDIFTGFFDKNKENNFKFSTKIMG